MGNSIVSQRERLGVRIGERSGERSGERLGERSDRQDHFSTLKCILTSSCLEKENSERDSQSLTSGKKNNSLDY